MNEKLNTPLEELILGRDKLILNGNDNLPVIVELNNRTKQLLLGPLRTNINDDEVVGTAGETVGYVYKLLISSMIEQQIPHREVAGDHHHYNLT